MGFAIDLEDVVGVALADLLRRTGLIVGSVLGAIGLAGLSLAVGEMLVALIEFRSVGGDVWDSVTHRFLWLVLAPLGDGLGFLYIPFLIGMGIYFVRADSPGPRALAACLGILSLLYVLSAGEPEWFTPSWWSYSLGGGVSDPSRSLLIMKGVAMILWLGSIAGLGFFSVLLERRARVKAEEHLMGVTIENERRRQELREKHGIVIAGRDYAVDEEPPA